MSLDCNDIQVKMAELRALKTEFDTAYHKKDFSKAKEMKKRLDYAFLEIKQPLFQHVMEQKTLLDYPVFHDWIARRADEVNENTKVYIGPLFDHFFEIIPDTCKYFYFAYPDQEMKIGRNLLRIYGDSLEQLIERVPQGKHFITTMSAPFVIGTIEFKRSLYQDHDCTILKNPETLECITLRMRDMGFSKPEMIKNILDRAQTLGLELCPPSVGLYQYTTFATAYLMNYKNLCIGMHPIVCPDFRSRIFHMYNNMSKEVVLQCEDYHDPIGPDIEFLFQLPKKSDKK